MKIINLQSENIKRLKAVEIKPDGSLVTIGGRNAQGKSSLLDSIEYALGGKPKVDRPIRDGEKSARVVLETEELIVTRSFTEKSSQLKVENRHGRRFSSPQAMLDKLYGSLTFDPLAFSRKSAREQAETLRALVGIDLTPLDKARQEAFEERTHINREIKSLEAQIDAIPPVEVQPVSISELTSELEKRNKYNQDGNYLCELKRQKEYELNGIETEWRNVLEQIAALRDRAIKLEEKKESIEKALQEVSFEFQKFQPQDTDEIRSQLAAAEETNRKAAQAEKRNELIEQNKAKCAEADKLTDTIKEIDAEKQATLAEASFPLDGLAFDESGVTMKGIPFEQCSSAEQLRISVAMGFAMNPELRVLLIREGSLLDSESMEVLRELAEQHEGQLWIEQVSETGKGCTVFIEDGAVKEGGE